MSLIEKNIFKKKRQFYNLELPLFCFLFFLITSSINAQDSIPAQKDLTEEAELKFQNYFFKALSNKSIGNHQKAIEDLESCNQILSNDVSVFFEFSKNYLSLNNTLLAKEYIKRALVKDEDNLWMLKHLVKIHQKENDLDKAIEIQKSITLKHPKERVFLVRLHLYNRDYEAASLLMETLELENALPTSLKTLKNNLANRNQNIKKVDAPLKDVHALIESFKNEKSFSNLQLILSKLEDDDLLLQYSKEGMSLFPAQPFAYLVQGKILNNKKEYKKALTTLKNGIDFVIEDKMEVNFYKEIAEAYKGLGNEKEEKKYKLKAKKIKI